MDRSTWESYRTNGFWTRPRAFECSITPRQMNCTPIIWNHWERLPADSARLATLTMGRVIECCTPVVISDADGIHELVELTGRYKIPARRVIEASGEAIVDLEYAWGLDNAFNMVTKYLPAGMARSALDRYRSLG